jgi:hypothetical protein
VLLAAAGVLLVLFLTRRDVAAASQGEVAPVVA